MSKRLTQLRDHLEYRWKWLTITARMHWYRLQEAKTRLKIRYWKWREARLRQRALRLEGDRFQHEGGDDDDD